MKLLIVSQYFWPENFRVNDLAAELVQRGHEVTVLTGVPNYPTGTVFESYRRNPVGFREYAGAGVVRVPLITRGEGQRRLLFNYASFVLTASLLGTWRLRKQPFDVIFVYEPSPVTVGLPAILLGRLKKAPVIFWVLDLWPETLAAVGVVKSPRALAVIGRMVRFIYDRCALVLGQSRGFLPSIARHCTDVSRLRYFPSWAEDVYAQEDKTPAPEVPYRPDLFNVLFAGNIGEAQDMPAVLEAAVALRDDPRFRWLIVGDGRKSDWLQQEVVKLGLEDKVLLMGRHPIERMPSFYAHADALLVSLKSDPVFGMTIPGKVQSYLLAGVPLLGMLDGEGAAVIHESGAGYTCPAGDGRALTDAALRMAGLTREARTAMGHRGREYAQREFGRKALIDRLELMFDEVRGQRS